MSRVERGMERAVRRGMRMLMAGRTPEMGRERREILDQERLAQIMDVIETVAVRMRKGFMLYGILMVSAGFVD